MFVLALTLLACGSAPAPAPATPAAPAAAVELTLGAYTTPREAYGRTILPAFAAEWKKQSGQDVTFKESYQGSGAQARAVVEGFEADVVALSLDPDVATVEKAGFITHPWRAGADGGIVSESIVVFAVRPGNPKNIHDWADLARPDVEVLTPNVRTSGGAMWNVAAAYGAATRGHAGLKSADPAAAEGFLSAILANVKVMDKSGRDSMITFEKGVGDVAITYENEAVVAKQEGQAVEYVVPTSTIRIENPAAVVDSYAAKHGTTKVAEAFVNYLHTPAAQAAFAQYGYRPPGGTPTTLPAVTDLFSIRDLGGWDAVNTSLFAKDGVYDRALAAAQAKGGGK